MAPLDVVLDAVQQARFERRLGFGKEEVYCKWEEAEKGARAGGEKQRGKGDKKNKSMRREQMQKI